MWTRERTATALAWWDGRVRSVVFDFVVAAGASWLNLHDRQSHAPPALTLSVSAAMFVGLLLRRRFPLVAAAAAFAGSAVGVGTVPMMVAVHTVAARRGPGLKLWGTAIAGVAIFVVLGWPGEADGWPYLALASGLFVVLPMFSGLWLFQRQKLVVALQERADQAERERDLLAERAVTAERSRIAREMHDVVAHRVTVIALQAGALSVTSGDPRTSDVAEVIRKTSTTALTELRDILHVLRDEDTRDTTEPASPPGLAAIGQLIEGAAEAGAAVAVELPDPLPDTTGAVGRAAYRVVQEALTNSAKHAPGAAVLVTVAVWEAELVVEVSNQDSAGAGPDPVPGSGYGLIGMRERVSLAGGTMRSGRADGGGYLVRAQFPLEPGEEAS
ncbi:MAG: two-component sensor histidine kinase [Amycolatopsis sp.]|uniref:sensor histidine kinase n=1 Tax=Amycolatopsis sp. TaxID=37632 RepID=UPI0026304115|nr:histidine kinase [Amycolatopsis sp.]MCU1684424.1 two-component sensor histidine kinase [Amycolatopsis sp.]